MAVDFPTWLTHDESEETITPCRTCGRANGDLCEPGGAVLLTGSRHLTRARDGARLAEVLRFARLLHPHAVLLEGGAPGADTLGRELWKSWGLEVRTFPADWDAYGNAAGPMRNADMVAQRPAVCLAFPKVGSVGTWDCVRQAEAAAVPVQVFPMDAGR